MHSTSEAGSGRAKRRRTRGVFERPKGSGVWWIRYHDEYGREHREKVGPKGLAGELYRRRKTEIAERRFFPERIRRRDVLLADFLEAFLRDHVQGRLRNALHYRRYAERWSQTLGTRALRQIVPGDVARFVRQRQEAGFAPASINRELAFLRRAFNVAIGDHLADTNPVRAVKLFRENNQRVRILGDDEETRLREELGEEHWPKVTVALYTGFRRSNCFRLRWAEDVNFDSGSLRAHQPKGGTDYYVPMNADLRDPSRPALAVALALGFPERTRATRRSTPRTSSTASSGRPSGVPASPTSPGTTSATRSPRGSRWRA
jgi:Phage integrase, N-terminal SAM-like domain